MLTFGIPLKPRRAARSWPRVVADLNRTLASIWAQTDPRFRVVVACTDRPPVAHADPRLHFLRVSDEGLSGESDKQRRLRAIGAWLRERGGGALMPVDADDLVNRKVVRFVNAHPEVEFFVTRVGLDLDARNGRIRPLPRFWKLCGTSAAIRFAPEDLPEHVDAGGDGLLEHCHNQWRILAEARGMRIRSFPFLASVYCVFNGENITLNRRFEQGPKLAAYRKLVPNVRAPRWLWRRFGQDDAPSISGEVPALA
jgi:hypothetical protein